MFKLIVVMMVIVIFHFVFRAFRCRSDDECGQILANFPKTESEGRTVHDGGREAGVRHKFDEINAALVAAQIASTIVAIGAVIIYL